MIRIRTLNRGYRLLRLTWLAGDLKEPTHLLKEYRARCSLYCGIVRIGASHRVNLIAPFHLGQRAATKLFRTSHRIGRHDDTQTIVTMDPCSKRIKPTRSNEVGLLEQRSANDHMVQNLPCWRASVLIFRHWDDKAKRPQPVKLDWPLFQCPSVGIMSLLSSMADFVPCKGVFTF